MVLIDEIREINKERMINSLGINMSDFLKLPHDLQTFILRGDLKIAEKCNEKKKILSLIKKTR